VIRSSYILPQPEAVGFRPIRAWLPSGRKLRLRSRRFSQQACAHQNSRPSRRTPFKATYFPHTSFLRSRYPFTHSQWLQDLYPALFAKLPGNWLLLLHRSAPLSLLCALASPLLPRRLSHPSSSRPVESRQLTLPVPRRPSTVIFHRAWKAIEQKADQQTERADWPKEKLLVSQPLPQWLQN
jgi:hypothetical protein